MKILTSILLLLLPTIGFSADNLYQEYKNKFDTGKILELKSVPKQGISNICFAAQNSAQLKNRLYFYYGKNGFISICRDVNESSDEQNINDLANCPHIPPISESVDCLDCWSFYSNKRLAKLDEKGKMEASPLLLIKLRLTNDGKNVIGRVDVHEPGNQYLDKYNSVGEMYFLGTPIKKLNFELKDGNYNKLYYPYKVINITPPVPIKTSVRDGKSYVGDKWYHRIPANERNINHLLQ